jgi:hypothetical protein
VFIPDHDAVVHAMTAYPAIMAGDHDTCANEAAIYEEFGLTGGAPAVLAEGAVVWLGAGRADKAEALLDHLSEQVLTGLPRDGD